uniref:Uncharacterized protein n=1 Tax=Caenorhabditis japonica TaxID=281687 RepID=A0A8R1I8C7_CAEJA
MRPYFDLISFQILFHFYEQYQQSLVLVEGPKTDYPFVEHRQNGRRLYSLKNTSIKVLKDGDKNEENNNIKLVEEFLSKHSDLKNNKLPQSALSVIVAAPGIQFSNYNLYTFIPQKVYATSKIFSCYQFITKNIQVKWFNDGKNVILAGYIINLGDAVCLEKQLNLLARKLEAQEAEERSRNINRRILYRSTWCNHFNAQCVSYRKERREGEAEEEKENYLDTVALMFSPVESRIRRANCADCRQREEDCEESSQYVFIEHIDHNRPRS